MLKDKSKKKEFFRALLLGLLPLVVCGIFLLCHGKTIGDVDLTGCTWNDELYYYKQVEAILDYGYPLGYFGFNESHALSLSYAAWSPVLIWPWVLWGLVFGWNLLSPILCNIVIYMITLFCFALLTRPTTRQTIGIAAVFSAFSLNLRYMFSCMPEIICFSHMIFFYGFAIRYVRERRARFLANPDAPELGKDVWLLAGMFVTGILMTWMRPYCILTLLLPAWFMLEHKVRQIRVETVDLAVTDLAAADLAVTDLAAADSAAEAGASYETAGIKKDKQKDKKMDKQESVLSPSVLLLKCLPTLIFLAGIFGLTFAVYVLINHYLAAPYFTDLFYTKWITDFFTKGFVSGVKGVLYTLYDKGTTFLRYALQGCLTGLWSGTFFAAHLAIMAVLFWTVVEEVKAYKANAGKKTALPYANQALYLPLMVHQLFSLFAMMMAVILMYKLNEGSKHLLMFLSASMLVLVFSEKRAELKAALLTLLFVWLFWLHVIGGEDFAVPFAEDWRDKTCAYWEETLASELVLDEDKKPSYENTLIWVIYDSVVAPSEQEPAPEFNETSSWQMLYYLPSGTGISCCYPDYVIENFDSLTCRYIATVCDGTIDSMCLSKGYTIVGTDGDLIVYDRMK